MIDLTKFCKPHHRYFGEPWSSGEYSYATDGAIAIRIPKIDIKEKPKHLDVDSVIEEAKEKASQDWVVPPPVKIKQSKCYVCDGDGYLYMCITCNGDGCHDCDNVGCLTKTDWISTFGKADINEFKVPCPDCEGTGIELEYSRVTIHGTAFDGKYIKLIDELPNSQISVCSEIALFRFDGGEGALMPIRL
jgi:hypothetical protein